MILLIHESADNAHVAMPAQHINGTFAPERHYTADGRFLVLDGHPVVIAHDALEICKNPAWQLANPTEQDLYAKGKRKSSQLLEAVDEPEESVEDNALPVKTKPAGLYTALR